MLVSKLTAQIQTVSKSALLLHLKYHKHSTNSTQQKWVTVTDIPTIHIEQQRVIFHTWDTATTLCIRLLPTFFNLPSFVKLLEELSFHA